MENQITKIITKNKISVRAVVIFLTFSLIVIGMVLGVLEFKKVAVKFKIIATSVDDQLKINLNSAREIVAGVSDEMFLDMYISAKDEVVISKMVFFSTSALANNFRLYKLGIDSVNDNTSFVQIGQAATYDAQTKTLTFDNMNLVIYSGERINLWIKGDVDANSPSGKVVLQLKNIVAVSGNKKIGDGEMRIDVKSGILSIVGNDKVATINAVSLSGSQSVSLGSTQTIKWSTENLPTGIPVSIFLFKQELISDMKTYTPVDFIAFNTDNDGQESWTVSNDLLPGDNYLIKVNCGLGFDLPYGCNAGRSGLFSIVK